MHRIGTVFIRKKKTNFKGKTNECFVFRNLTVILFSICSIFRFKGGVPGFVIIIDLCAKQILSKKVHMAIASCAKQNLPQKALTEKVYKAIALCA